MHKIRKTLTSFSLLFSLTCLLFSCTTTEEKAALEKLAWLEGAWENESEGRKTVEIWEKQKKHAFAVQGFLIEGSDTIFQENITVKASGNKLAYTVTIPDQNQGLPVSFNCIQNTGSRVVFSNPNHDFPKFISYTKTGANAVLIELKGKVNGKTIQESYTLKRRPGQ